MPSPNRQPRGATASPTASSDSPAFLSHGGGIGRWPLAPLIWRREKSWERLTMTSGRCLTLLRGRDRGPRARGGSAESRFSLMATEDLVYRVALLTISKARGGFYRRQRLIRFGLKGHIWPINNNRKVKYAIHCITSPSRSLQTIKGLACSQSEPGPS